MRRFIKWGIGIFLLLIVACVVLVIALPSDNTPSTTDARPTSAQVQESDSEVATLPTTASQPAEAPPPTDTPAPESQFGKVGERIVSNGIGISVIDVQRVNQVSLFSADEGKIYIDLEVLIENIDRDETPYNPLYFKIKDSDGFEYNTAIASLDPSLKSGTLSKGDRARGHVAFEVQESASGLVVSYEPIVIFGGYQPIRINLEEISDAPLTVEESEYVTPTGKVGEILESAGVELMVLSTEKLETMGIFSADTGYIYLDLEVVIKNAGRNESIPYNPLYFSLKDSDGYEYNTAVASKEPTLKSGELVSEDMVRGHVTFEIPETATGLFITYEPQVVFGGYKPIRVDLESFADTFAKIPEPIAHNPYELGAPVEAAGIALTVLEVQMVDSIDLMSADEEKVYLDIEVIIQNIGRDETTPYNPLYFFIKDQDGYEYSPNFVSLEPSLTSGELEMDDMVRGHIAFEIPESAGGLVVGYVPMVILGGYQVIYINLGL